MKRLFIFSLIPLCFMTPAAHAQNWHLGAGYTHAFLPSEDESLEDVIFSIRSSDMSIATLRGGYDFSHYFGIEADGGIGLSSSTLDVSAEDVDIPFSLQVKIKYMAALYGKVMLPMDANVALFARAGGYHINSKVGALGMSESGGSEGVTGGTGIELKASQSVSFRLDYTAIDIEDTTQTVGISVLTRF